MTLQLKSILSPFNLLLLAIILLSFFLTSTAYSPRVNSDMAINVLMAHYFEWPNDVYFWGQNRLGSFVPLTAHGLISLTGMSAVLAVSICNYLILFLGFLGFSTLFKERFTILLFALLWFFPYDHFFGLNVFPLGLSYGLFGFSILLYKQLKIENEKLFSIRNVILGVLILITLIAAVWISDLLMITLVILALSLLFRIILNKSKRSKLNFLKLIGFLIVLIVIYWFDLNYLKSLSDVEIKQFASFNTLEQVGEAIAIVLESFKHLFFLNGINIIGLGAWILLISFLLGTFLFFRKLKYYFFFKDFWTSFFFLDFLGIMLVIYFSHWVLLNEMGSWYFVAPYISACIWILRVFEKGEIFRFLTFKVGALVAVLIISSGQIWEVFRNLGEYKSTASKVRELEQFGEIGVVGNYWESYKFSLVNPEMVMSTPHDKSDIRKPDRIIPTMLRKRLFFVRDNWLDSFPDSISQFGFSFKKYGSEMRIAGSYFCEYRPVFNTMIDQGKTLVLNGDRFISTAVLSPQDSTLRFDQNRSEKYHSMYGPKIALPKGKYELRLFLNEYNLDELNDNLLVDVSIEGGTKVPVISYLGKAKRLGRYFVFNFELDKPVIDWELRFHEEKLQNFVFDHVELDRIK